VTLSLRQRLGLSAALVLALFLGAVALLVDGAFNLSLEGVVRDKLTLHGNNLLRRGDVHRGRFILPATLAQVDFNKPGGRLVALVRKVDQDTGVQEHWRSLSAQQTAFDLPVPPPGDWHYGRYTTGAGESYFVANRSVLWPENDGGRATYVISVLENSTYIAQQQRRSRQLTALILFSLALVLLLSQLTILGFGLRPLRRFTENLGELNAGATERLADNYPRELQGLADNLNLLLQNERRQRQRYQDRMADLSHSLKTPLSILRGLDRDTNAEGELLQREALLKTLEAQVQRMGEIVDYQLQRAVTGGSRASFIAVQLAAEAQALADALAKVYRERLIDCEVQIATGLSLFADEHDVAEILGNLMDNAFKHARSQVAVTASSVHDGQNWIEICVDDDGPGIAEQDREHILHRGVRLDTSASGQGFGLAIVIEIVHSYGGSLHIERSALGGARFRVMLPGGKQHPKHTPNNTTGDNKQ
jgi:two-component system sensor histidine kinase PhoQ